MNCENRVFPRTKSGINTSETVYFDSLTGKKEENNESNNDQIDPDFFAY